MIQKLQHHNGREYLLIDFKDFSVEFELGEYSRIRYIKGETTTYLANDFTITIDELPKIGIHEILIKNDEASFKWIGHDLEGMFMFIARGYQLNSFLNELKPKKQ